MNECPKCGFHQDNSEECLRCGLVFARYRLPRIPEGRVQPKAPQPFGLLRRCYRVFRWVTLIILLSVLLLVLRPAAPPRITTSPGAGQSAEAKVRDFQRSAAQGEPTELGMNEAELNAWLGANLALKRPATQARADVANALVTGGAHALPEAETDSGRPTVQDVKIELFEDSLRAYVAMEFYGKELSLELEGRLLVRDGCIRLEPTAGKLGSLPLPSGTLQSAAQRLFDSPENREKFRLQPGIGDVQVKHGTLIVTTRKAVE